MPTLVPVILAGGEGKRLWPLSSETLPKQFLKLSDKNDSLFQNTVQRAMQIAEPEHVITITSEKSADIVHAQLGALHPFLTKNIVLETEGRNTAAAVTLAANYAAEHFDMPILWVIPSDHMVSDTEQISQAVENCMVAAAYGKVITFGIQPTRADSNYGYIMAGAQLKNHDHLKVVRRFLEKPSGDLLRWAFVQGGCLWNSGMFLMSAETLFIEMKKYGKEILQQVSNAYTKGEVTAQGYLVDGEAYCLVPKQPIDKAMMEKTSRMLVTPLNVGWSDVGSWYSVWEMSQKGGAGQPLDNFLSKIKRSA